MRNERFKTLLTTKNQTKEDRGKTTLLLKKLNYEYGYSTGYEV